MTLKNNTHKRKLLMIIITIVIAFVAVCAVYLSDYYHADEAAVETFVSADTVVPHQDEAGNYIFEPAEAETGVIFYPGGKVECEAYIPLMQELASEGIFGVLVEMPFNLAVFDINAADGIQEQYPEIKRWYIGGHSLGGSMAASYLADHTDSFEGLLLLGSYSATDLSVTDLEVISIYGSEDNVLDHEKYESNKVNLPEDFSEIVIDGGCHAYFGMYGEQDGDGDPDVTNESQIKITADIIAGAIE